MKVYAIGSPSWLGGADTELFHTIKLWRAGGVDVHIVPTWGVSDEWREKLLGIGCTVHTATAENIADVPGLAGSVCVSFCNGQFLKVAHKLRAAGCPLVWVNCMTFLFPEEREFIATHGPFEASVFQSEFQRGQLEPHLLAHGYTRDSGHLIRGAFDCDEWTFNYTPRAPGDAFWLGRVARPDPDKWSSNTYAIYERINHNHKRGLLLGVDDKVRHKLGAPPWWIDVLKPQQIPVREFYSRIHCLLPVNGGARENWPRAGLEAMAAGVPVVAQREWGWKEMIVHGETGFLGSTDEELAHWAAVLAHDEPLRKRLAEAARFELKYTLACPVTIWNAWERIFQAVGSQTCQTN